MASRPDNRALAGVPSLDGVVNGEPAMVLYFDNSHLIVMHVTLCIREKVPRMRERRRG